MKANRITVEHCLYLLAFILALGVRFMRLGVAPLSDFEASWALQAWQVTQGGSLVIGPQPGYVILTGLMFYIFSSTNFLARFWPALAGSLLVWLPLLFYRPLGKKAALILAFGLALDPGLVALSRLAGGPMFALGFGLLALGFIYNRSWIWGGVLAGLAILGGPAILMGGSGLALAWVAWRLLRSKKELAFPVVQEPSAQASINGIGQQGSLPSGLLAGGGTVLLAGTLFFFLPQGLNALAGIIPAYFKGWVSFSEVPASRLLAALLVYQPLALILAGVAAVRAWMSGGSTARWLCLWAVGMLGLVLLYPSRETGDLVWVLVPVWALASLELARHFQAEDWERLPAFGQAALLFFLLALAWLNLAGLNYAVNDAQLFSLRWAVIGGTLMLGTVTTLLIALGWSGVVAQRGLVWGLSAALGVYSLGALLGATQLRPNGAMDLWYPTPVTQEADLFFRTLGDLAEWRNGVRDTIDLVVLAPEPSLQWALRDWHGAHFASDVGVGELPEVLVTPGDQPEPKLAMAYRGQDFAWQVSPGWSGGLPADWESWITFRDGPEQLNKIILWARADLFPGGKLAPAESQPAAPDQQENIPPSVK
jgi:hypothetical protein